MVVFYKNKFLIQILQDKRSQIFWMKKDMPGQIIFIREATNIFKCLQLRPWLIFLKKRWSSIMNAKSNKMMRKTKFRIKKLIQMKKMKRIGKMSRKQNNAVRRDQDQKTKIKSWKNCPMRGISQGRIKRSPRSSMPVFKQEKGFQSRKVFKMGGGLDIH